MMAIENIVNPLQDIMQRSVNSALNTLGNI